MYIKKKTHLKQNKGGKAVPKRVEVKQHTCVPSAIAKVPLPLAGLIVCVSGDKIPGINTSRTVDIMR